MNCAVIQHQCVMGIVQTQGVAGCPSSAGSGGTGSVLAFKQGTHVKGGTLQREIKRAGASPRARMTIHSAQLSHWCPFLWHTGCAVHQLQEVFV